MGDEEHIRLTEDNEHLGQVVSGTNQIEKNIDLRLTKGRGSLFKLLGHAFAYKCLLSPVVKLHLFRTFHHKCSLRLVSLFCRDVLMNQDIYMF